MLLFIIVCPMWKMLKHTRWRPKYTMIWPSSGARWQIWQHVEITHTVLPDGPIIEQIRSGRISYLTTVGNTLPSFIIFLNQHSPIYCGLCHWLWCGVVSYESRKVKYYYLSPIVFDMIRTVKFKSYLYCSRYS